MYCNKLFTLAVLLQCDFVNVLTSVLVVSGIFPLPFIFLFPFSTVSTLNLIPQHVSAYIKQMFTNVFEPMLPPLHPQDTEYFRHVQSLYQPENLNSCLS